MDPATIIGTTSAILSFVVFTGSVISTAIKIHGNADGATLENQTFEDVVTELEQKYGDLKAKLGALTSASAKDPSDSSSNSDAAKSLMQSLDKCTALGKRIHGLLDKTKASAKPEHLTQRVKGKIRKAIGKSETTCKPTLLEVMRAGLQTVWNKDEIDALRQQWETCMIQLNGAIFRFETGERLDIIFAVSEQNSTQLGDIRKLVKTLAQQFDESKFQSLWSLVDGFKNADYDSNLAKRNHEWILKALEFDSMDARRKQVKTTAEGTFRWCVTEDSIPPDHPDLEMSFREWLATGNGVYHITGKPGSGKSTIMKLIDEAEETEEQLQCWTGTQDSKTLVRACFYTWKAADSSPLQNSIEGLERTLLHDILSGAPELTPKVFRKHWTPKNFSIANVVTQSGSTTRTRQFGLEELHHALDSIIQVHGPAHNLRLFFLIDGLDEFINPHEHSDLSTRICSWASCNPSGVKICVSSREENAFMNTFPATQRLRLHLVTGEDVRVLTEKSLRKHGHFSSYPDEDQQELIDLIVLRAEGVYLWLVLTIWELKELLDDGQGFQALEVALRSFPGELNEFFEEIMGRIPKRYYNEARAVLMVAASLSHRYSKSLKQRFCLSYYAKSVCLRPL